MPLTPGTTLGPYEIQSPLGAGGMGEVYKATDTRLDRTVAIKVLLAHVADDPDLRQRFEREAKTISSLNHPHICTLHDIGQQDGIDYLVMEYLEGETLAQRLTKGPLPLDQVLRYATEIADALDKAHRKGITHRDLKPGNIMLTKAGTKLLDFGLAKLRDPKTAGLSLSQRPTQSASLTGEGKILGTLQYMAPEQLEGKDADARTDIFAFGAILYEMTTGRKAFEGGSQASLIHAIMGVDPPAISSLQPMSPRALDQIVKTCLAKDPDDRWQSAGDLGRQLKIIQGGSQPSVAVPVAPTPQRSSWRQGIPLAVATLVVGSLITGVAAWNLRSPVPQPLARFVVTTPADGPLQTAVAQTDVAISPDGMRILYSGGAEVQDRQLYVRQLDEIEATPLRGTSGGSSPFFSPDGEWVGFRQDDALKKVSVLGGPPVTICEDCVPGGGLRGASWGTDDIIVFASTGSGVLLRVPAVGGEPEVLATVDPELGEILYWPEVVPNGHAVLFTVNRGGVEAVRLPTGELVSQGQGFGDIAVLDLETGEQTILVRGGSNPRYSPTGHIVYGVAGTLRGGRV